MTRDRVLIWVVLVLLAVNIATIISALRYSGKVKSDGTEAVGEVVDARQILFREHLGLTASQERDFVRLNSSFSQNAGRMTVRLDQLRREMVEELSRPDPEMKVIEKITEEIGSLHSNLKMETAEYYLGMKKVCTPEQQVLLREMFMVMSDPEGDLNTLFRGPIGPGPGGRGRNMRGFGRGMNRFNFK